MIPRFQFFPDVVGSLFWVHIWIDRSIDCVLLYVTLEMFHSYGDVTNNSGGLLNSELCSVLIASLLGGNFIVPHPL